MEKNTGRKSDGDTSKSEPQDREELGEGTQSPKNKGYGVMPAREADQAVWYSHLFQNFPRFVVIHIVKGFGVVNKAEVEGFFGTLLLFR